MGLKEDKTITDIVQAVRESDAKKTKGYDTQATVIRVEDGKAWVHIPGGVPETPAELTINAQPGDSVMVRLAGGRAFLLGNATSPPTDDATAREALSNVAAALQSAVSAKRAADSAEASAATAGAAAQYAVETAESVHGIAVQAQTDAETAKSAAQSAQSSANGALNGLSTVQDVIGVLDWAKDNATYTLTSDPDIEPGKTYWTRSGSGTSADPYTYTPVVTPVKADLGTYYEISGVDEAMADYINTHLALTDEGLFVLGGANQWKVLIAPDGVYIIDGTSGVDKVVAKYKDSITLGMDDGTESYQRLDYNSLRLIARGETTPFFWVSDLRDKDDNYQATITETFRADGATNTFSVRLDVSAEVSATDSSHSSSTATRNGKNYTFATTPSEGATVTIVYKTTSELAKAYTLGRRYRGGVGPMSAAEGIDVTASGYASHAEGVYTEASGRVSHAEGDNTTASGDTSHAEGSSSIASGSRSHAEGVATKATAQASHAQNLYTEANYKAQTAIGKYNRNRPNNAFEIGNGTEIGDRSNAFSVDWDGKVTLDKAGGIAHQGTKSVNDMIIFLDNTADEYGTGILIGGNPYGGVVIIGSGEYAHNRWAVGDLSAATEQTYIGSDSNVHIEPNGQNIGDRRTSTFAADGNLHLYGDIRPYNTAQRAGVSYIAGARGDKALIYAPHSTNNQWTPTLVQRTKGQGSWQIGNYDDERLQFAYATKANIDSQTNSVVSIFFGPDGNVQASKFNGYTLDLNTNNTSDTRVPVLTGSTLQHRVIPRGKTVQKVNKTLPNCTVAAGSVGTFQIDTPTLSGYTVVGIMDVWFDGQGTSGAAYSDRLICANHWADTGTKTSIAVRNLHTNQAKFTINASWIFALDL